MPSLRIKAPPSATPPTTPPTWSFPSPHMDDGGALPAFGVRPGTASGMKRARPVTPDFDDEQPAPKRVVRPKARKAVAAAAAAAAAADPDPAALPTTGRNRRRTAKAAAANLFGSPSTTAAAGAAPLLASPPASASKGAASAPSSSSSSGRRRAGGQRSQSAHSAFLARPPPYAYVKGDPPQEAVRTGRWTRKEDELLQRCLDELGVSGAWRTISRQRFRGCRTEAQCQDRYVKVLKPGLKKGAWSKDEDKIVLDAVAAAGGQRFVRWGDVAELGGLEGRLGKQVRERFQNHLDPQLIKSPWLGTEDLLLLALQAMLGNRWSEIARAFPGRSENAVKNRWNSKNRQRAMKQIDPLAHARVDLREAIRAVLSSDGEVDGASRALFGMAATVADAADTAARVSEAETEPELEAAEVADVDAAHALLIALRPTTVSPSRSPAPSASDEDGARLALGLLMASPR